MAEEKKYKYRVKSGYEYGPYGEYKSGSIIELTAEQAKYVMDKLELAEIVIPGSAEVHQEPMKQEENVQVPEDNIPPVFSEGENDAPQITEVEEEIRPRRRKSGTD